MIHFQAQLFYRTPLDECFWRKKYSEVAVVFSSRSSHPEVFCKKGVLRNVAKFTGKHLYTGVFLWILQNFQEHLFSQNTSGGCFYSLPHPPILLDRHWNSRITSVWPLNLWIGFLNSDVFQRNKLFSLLRNCGTKTVTSPFPNGWNYMIKIICVYWWRIHKICCVKSSFQLTVSDIENLVYIRQSWKRGFYIQKQPQQVFCEKRCS